MARSATVSFLPLTTRVLLDYVTLSISPARALHNTAPHTTARTALPSSDYIGALALSHGSVTRGPQFYGWRGISTHSRRHHHVSKCIHNSQSTSRPHQSALLTLVNAHADTILIRRCSADNYGWLNQWSRDALPATLTAAAPYDRT